MHPNSMKLMRYFKYKYLEDQAATILDIGSQRVKRNHQTYSRIFKPPYKYTGMDIVPGRNVDIVGYKNIVGTYDVVISGQVMEHVNKPWVWLKNLTKYFTKYICIIVPNTLREHKYPLDTYRYFPDGMRDLFNYAKIIELEIFKDQGDTIGIGTRGKS